VQRIAGHRRWFRHDQASDARMFEPREDAAFAPEPVGEFFVVKRMAHQLQRHPLLEIFACDFSGS